MADSQRRDHTVTVTDSSNGFAPAQVCTTTYGIEYLLQALRNMSPEAPEMALHEILVAQCHAALNPAAAQSGDAGLGGLRQVVLSLRAMQSEVRRVVNGALSWEDKFDLIFSDRVSKRVYALFSEAGLRFDYYDPNGSYEEDIRAFAEALDSRLGEVTNFFEPA